MLQPKNLSARQVAERLPQFWRASATKILSLSNADSATRGTPVFTVNGRYTSQGWTEWTQGFEFGSSILQFDATEDESFLHLGREATKNRMSSHVTHFGVHDHGFNNVSTYGALLRLVRERRFHASDWEAEFYAMALRASGAIQAMRWSPTVDGGGYIYSFNGPHSLFCDTIRSLRSLAYAHKLQQRVLSENDATVCLLDRLIQHAKTTAQYNIYYGEGRDTYDVRGRVAHESIFNCNDGRYRCPSTQQGYSPFSTWTRGLAWIMLGYSEQLEFLETLPDEELDRSGGRVAVESFMLRAASAACDYYLETTPIDGIPYWDTGAPGLTRLPQHADRVADPYNPHEPVDSSAAAIACQGLLRLGKFLRRRGDLDPGNRYWQAGLTILDSLLQDPYLCTDPEHQGLLLHAVYHRPRGWDQIHSGQDVPNGESCMWGDYHLREAALYLQRIAREEPYYTFFGP